jgi:hypothetical protein
MEKELIYNQIYDLLPWNDDQEIMFRAMRKLALVKVDDMLKLVYDNWYDSTNGVYEELEKLKVSIEEDIAANS